MGLEAIGFDHEAAVPPDEVSPHDPPAVGQPEGQLGVVGRQPVLVHEHSEAGFENRAGRRINQRQRAPNPAAARTPGNCVGSCFQLRNRHGAVPQG